MKTLKEVRGARMRYGLARLCADDGLVAHDGENALSNKREKNHAPGTQAVLLEPILVFSILK